MLSWRHYIVDFFEDNNLAIIEKASKLLDYHSKEKIIRIYLMLIDNLKDVKGGCEEHFSDIDAYSIILKLQNSCFLLLIAFCNAVRLLISVFLLFSPCFGTSCFRIYFMGSNVSFFIFQKYRENVVRNMEILSFIKRRLEQKNYFDRVHFYLFFNVRPS